LASDNPLTSGETETAGQDAHPSVGPSEPVVRGEVGAQNGALPSPGAPGELPSPPNSETNGREEQDTETAAVEASADQEPPGDYSQPSEVRQGELCRGRVVGVLAEGVVVDIGGKTEGLIPSSDFGDSDAESGLAPGDEIEVFVVSRAAAGDYASLSYQRARRLRAWEKVEQAYRGRETLTARVVGRVKGGLSVDLGIPAFLPGSHVSLDPSNDLDGIVGEQIEVRIVKLSRTRGNVVVSRRQVLEEELRARKEATLAKLGEGGVITGTVKSLTGYGAFVDLGGLDALLHVTDISYRRIQGPSEILSVGEEITAKVLRFDPARERVSLSLKQLQPDPWQGAQERYKEGDRVCGCVVSVTDYGIFVELEPGVEGLVHVSEISWSRRVRHPSKVAKPGEDLSAIILSVDQKQRRVSLSIKGLRPDPWSQATQRYPIGSIVEGQVRNLAAFGAFVEIEEGLEGLLHVSDLSWDGRVKHPREALRKGQKVKAAVLRVEEQNRRVSLGLKQLQSDQWDIFFADHMVGDTIRGAVKRRTNFGAFVEVAPGVQGLWHHSEIPTNSYRKGTNPLRMGQEYEFKIIRLDEFEKRIGLRFHSAIHRNSDAGAKPPRVEQPASGTGTAYAVGEREDLGSPE
jgi:small subunit ribosomal protein S1